MTRLLKTYSYAFSSFGKSLFNVYDLKGGKRNYSVNSMIGISDERKIEDDWINVGQYIKYAIKEYSKYDK